MSIVQGVVVVGDRRGRLLGYPTANVETTTELPDDGVYAGRLERGDGTILLAAVSIGRRPTYYAEGVRLLEAYVLDFSGDLYGEHVRVEVGPRVRPQLRFDSSEALIAQMDDDIGKIRALAAADQVALGELEEASEQEATG